MDTKTTTLIGLLAALSLAVSACERKTNSSGADTSDEPSAAEKPTERRAEPEPPSAEERLETLREKEREEAEESITPENAESVASELEDELEEELDNP